MCVAGSAARVERWVSNRTDMSGVAVVLAARYAPSVRLYPTGLESLVTCLWWWWGWDRWREEGDLQAWLMCV